MIYLLRIYIIFCLENFILIFFFDLDVKIFFFVNFLLFLLMDGRVLELLIGGRGGFCFIFGLVVKVRILILVFDLIGLFVFGMGGSGFLLRLRNEFYLIFFFVFVR